MKLKHVVVSLLVATAAGCDTMEQDVDGKALSINNDPAYFLPNGDGFIDLPARILSPGKVRVEITGTTRHGELIDLGKGLLQYSRFKGSSSGSDSFTFRVFSDDNQVLREDSIGIIIPKDTINLPCKYIFPRPDSVWNVTGPVNIDVTANDYTCGGSLIISVQTQPENGTATMVGNMIKYVPNTSFAGSDRFIYKATVSDPSVPAAFAFVRIFGGDSTHMPPDSTSCVARAKDDLFFKPRNDSSLMYLHVLANDSICSDSTITITQHPNHGIATAYNNIRRISYRNLITSNIDDTLVYRVGAPGNSVARVIIKRQ